MQDDTATETTVDEAAAEGTDERTAAAEAIVEANAAPSVKAAGIPEVKAYFAKDSSQGEPSLQELKALMAKRPDGTSDMDDLKKALTPDAAGNISYTY